MFSLTPSYSVFLSASLAKKTNTGTQHTATNGVQDSRHLGLLNNALTNKRGGGLSSNHCPEFSAYPSPRYLHIFVFMSASIEAEG